MTEELIEAVDWERELRDRRILVGHALEHQLPALEECWGVNRASEEVRGKLRGELVELNKLIGAIDAADECRALVESLRDDARCGGRYDDPVDDYAYGLEQAADELE